MLATGQAPDEGPVAGVVLLESGFLFDHLRAVQAEPRFLGHQQIAAQPGGNRHAAKATDAARHHTDHGLVLLQIDNRRVDVGNCRQAEVGFLQAHAAGFQQQQGAGRDTVAVVFGGQFQRAGNFCSADFTEAAALERAFDGRDHHRQTIEVALGDHHAVVGLRHHALARQPRRHDPLKGVEQFAEGAGIEQGLGPLPGTEFDEAVLVEQRCAVSHGRSPRSLAPDAGAPRPASRRNRGYRYPWPGASGHRTSVQTDAASVVRCR
ncbi:hypothetical protein D9M71_503100 [compost metagenome]